MKVQNTTYTTHLSTYKSHCTLLQNGYSAAFTNYWHRAEGVILLLSDVI